MKLSTKGRYAVSAMFDLAANRHDGLVSAEEISRRQGISLSYLEQLLLKLKRAGLVHASKGPAGGYKLARKPAQVSIGAIIEATEGPLALASCIPSVSGCSDKGCCSTRTLWKNLSQKMSAVLDSVSLADLCEDSKR
jgi:Rrf2 family protein